MHKIVLNVIGFIILFSLIFACLQPVFIYKDESGIAVTQFYNEPVNSLDVLIVGASDARSFVLSPVIWNEAGIASLNLSINGDMNASSQYYLLREALRFQSPSVVLVSGAYLFEKIDFDDDSVEARFRQVLDNMRWSSVKFESVLDILSHSESQTFIDYLFPLLRYHDRTDLNEKDYDLSYKNQRNLYMGAWESYDTKYEEQTRPDSLIDSDTAPEIHDEYLTKIINLCKEKGIDVVLVNAAVCYENGLTTARHQALQDYANTQNVRLLDFNTPELYNATGIDASRDFVEGEHVNISGGTKASIFLAHYLRETFGFPDRREAPYDPHWNSVVELYHIRYNELLSKFPEYQ